ncbi:MAG: tetratricopeptide repeat protein [Bacteroidota bacterium]|nr:tetratricopeptide repeat protein [Bacteroidota bacterium]
MDRLKDLYRLYEDDPTDPFTLFAIGYEYLRQGEREKALRWYESIREVAPDYTGVYYHLGKLYVALGRNSEARRVYDAGIHMCRRVSEMKDLSELQQARMDLEDDAG